MHLTVRPFILDAPFLPKVYVLNNVSVQPVTSSGKHTIYHPEVSHGSTVMRLCPGCYAHKQLDLANWSSNSSPLEVTLPVTVSTGQTEIKTSIQMATSSNEVTTSLRLPTT